MIIEAIINAFMNFLDLIFQNIVIAPLPALSYVYEYMELIVSSGISLFCFIFPPSARGIMIIILSAHIAVVLYYLTLWILKKIPMINIH